MELSTPFDYILSHICFIRYYFENISPDKWRTNFTLNFVDNTGGKSNSTIFASTLRPCSKVYTARNNLLYEHPFYHQDVTDSIISTAPATFKFSHQKSTFNVVPGEIFDLPIKLIDELGQIVMFIATYNGPPSPYVLSPYQFTNGSIQIAGKPDGICQLLLETDTDYHISATVEIVLLNCPAEFVS